MKRSHILVRIALLGLALLSPTLPQLRAQLAQEHDLFLGSIHYLGRTPTNFSLYWNQVTPENAGKHASCEQSRDVLNTWLWLDRAYDFAKANGYLFKEHCLVWGHSSGEPAWLKALPQAEQLAEVEEWFQAVSARYPAIDFIDVVNEPLHDPPSYAAALGGAGVTGWDWVIWSYQKARQYFPNAKLLINDFNIINDNAATTRYLQLISLLQARGLIDGIGEEAHSFETVSVATLRANLDRLAATGLPVYISEYDVRGDDATQLRIYREQFPLFWEHPGVHGVTLWGYIQGEMWRNEAFLVSSTGVERPALVWLRQYLTGIGAVPVSSVSVSPTSATVNVGATAALTATVLPVDATDRNVSWSSSNTAVATVNSAGIVSGVAGGSATITATARSGGLTANAAITVPPPNALTVLPASLSFSSGAESASLAITANVSWTVSDNQTWITLAPALGSNNGAVIVSVTANAGVIGRSGTITVSGGGITRTVGVTQSGTSPGSGITYEAESAAFGSGVTIDTSSTGFNGTGFANFPTNGGFLQFNNVGGGTGGAATLAIRYALSGGPRIGVLLINGVAQNLTFAGTAGWSTWANHTVTVALSSGATNTIRIQSSGQDLANVDEITVTPGGGGGNTLTVAPASLAFIASPSIATFGITSNVSWTITDNQAWITVTPVSGANNATVTVAVATNTSTIARTGAFTITGGGLTQTVAVTQAGAAQTNMLTVAPTSLSFAAAAGSSTFAITSNVTWAITDNQTWITVTPVGGGNNATATVSVSAHTGATARTGVVTVTGGGLTQTVAVTQAGAIQTNTLTLAPTSLSLAAAAGTSAVAVSSNVAWTATDDQTWITVTPASGANNASLAVAVTANTAATARTGTITVTGGGLTRTVAVTQAGSTVTTTCTNPTPITLPFAQNGVGDFCFVTSGNVSFINSWNMQLVEINGVAFTNQWSNTMPPRIDGNYLIHYVATVPWAHFEANGSP